MMASCDGKTNIMSNDISGRKDYTSIKRVFFLLLLFPELNKAIFEKSALFFSILMKLIN